jgi:hypothetical protein
VGVVGLGEGDDVVAGRPERLDVVGGVVDVDVGLHLGLLAEEAQVAVGDAVLVQPRDGVADHLPVAPVHVQAVGDEADPHAGVRQPPQRVGATLDGGHRAEHPVLQDRSLVDAAEVGLVADAPLREVPVLAGRQVLHRHAEVVGDDRGEGRGEVAADAVEVDAEDHRARRNPRAASMNAKDLGVLAWSVRASST